MITASVMKGLNLQKSIGVRIISGGIKFNSLKFAWYWKRNLTTIHYEYSALCFASTNPGSKFTINLSSDWSNNSTHYFFILNLGFDFFSISPKESTWKNIAKTFYFPEKAPFALQIFTFLSFALLVSQPIAGFIEEADGR